MCCVFHVIGRPKKTGGLCKPMAILDIYHFSNIDNRGERKCTQFYTRLSFFHDKMEGHALRSHLTPRIHDTEGKRLPSPGSRLSRTETATALATEHANNLHHIWHDAACALARKTRGRLRLPVSHALRECLGFLGPPTPTSPATTTRRALPFNQHNSGFFKSDAIHHVCFPEGCHVGEKRCGRFNPCVRVEPGDPGNLCAGAMFMNSAHWYQQASLALLRSKSQGTTVTGQKRTQNPSTANRGAIDAEGGRCRIFEWRRFG